MDQLAAVRIFGISAAGIAAILKVSVMAVESFPSTLTVTTAVPLFKEQA
jgi:hypothetical protein